MPSKSRKFSIRNKHNLKEEEINCDDNCRQVLEDISVNCLRKICVFKNPTQQCAKAVPQPNCFDPNIILPTICPNNGFLATVCVFPKTF